MRPDLDFRTLRAQVESATWMPDFSLLYRRAGRVRMRDRMAVVGALVGTLAVFAPVALAGVFGRPSPSALGPNPDLGEPWSPLPSASALPSGTFDRTRSIRAVAGELPDGVLAAVDVCVEVPQARRCSLQVVALRPESPGQTSTFVKDALRQSSLDKLDHVELARLSPQTFMLSGEVSGGSRTNLKFRLDDPAAVPAVTPVLGPETREALGPTDRAVQLAQYGDLFGIRQSDGTLSLLVDQPPMARRSVVGGLPVQAGWWVTGADLHTGSPAVSVSTDQGRHWLARSLNVPPGIDAPTVVTLDGVTAHAFVRYSKGIRHFRTRDGGDSWQEVTTKIELPGPLSNDGALNGRAFDALVRPDRSVLLWVRGDSETVYLESLDGEHFGVVAGPTGGVEPVDNGFVSLADPPWLAIDGRDWHAATLPATVLPN
ncbi:glycoside hydrolase [Dactylosporangium sp. NBC_01737]|uniref:sialidase family protein n=1 Tax=Dactylosporangium sp. NBC_01737 TaxID=2975959 RepID=UPI002E0E937E|nr:glycoside hydrolase [Dactylosporangium sp. NBC_01737]